jgi:hypothetical protein
MSGWDSCVCLSAQVNPRTYIGSGKVQEIKSAVANTGATTVVFDDELSPGGCMHMHSYNCHAAEPGWKRHAIQLHASFAAANKISSCLLAVASKKCRHAML